MGPRAGEAQAVDGKDTCLREDEDRTIGQRAIGGRHQKEDHSRTTTELFTDSN